MRRILLGLGVLIVVVGGIVWTQSRVTQVPQSVPAAQPTISSSSPAPNGGTSMTPKPQGASDDARQKFFADYQQRKQSRLEYQSNTQEGDPITYTLEYAGTGTQLRLSVDASKDKFGTQSIQQYTCQALVQEGDKLRLVSCFDGKVTTDITLP